MYNKEIDWMRHSCSVHTTVLKMIQCDTCDKWFHWLVWFLFMYLLLLLDRNCVQISTEPSDWHCETCQRSKRLKLNIVE